LRVLCHSGLIFFVSCSTEFDFQQSTDLSESRAGASSSSSSDDVVDPFNLKKDDRWRNLSFAQVAGVGNEGCVVGVVVGRCTWEAVYSTNSPSNKSSFAASTLWSLALASCVDWGAASRR
jgi:hypothetical protein